MAVDSMARRPTWNDRVFDAIDQAPFVVMAGLWLCLSALFLATVYATGDLAAFLREDRRWWQDRDVRLAVVLILLAAYLPGARRYQELGTRHNLERLATGMVWPPGTIEAARQKLQNPDERSRRIAGLLALLVIPVTALLVDRDPSLYLRGFYWDAVHLWMAALAVLICWNGGVLIHSITVHTRIFADLAQSVREIDLLDLETAQPFTRQALLSALPGVMIVSFFALNLVDRGFLWAFGVLGPAALAPTVASLWFVLRRAHERIRRAKLEELASVNAAIRSRRSGLDAEPEGRGSPGPGLADLLAYRRFVESISEWPFDAPLRARLVLYVAIPIGSWLGGALVERWLDGVLSAGS